MKIIGKGNSETNKRIRPKIKTEKEMKSFSVFIETGFLLICKNKRQEEKIISRCCDANR